MAKACAKFLVKGRVQGVGFRFHTAHTALKLDLTGYAKNLVDGNVEVIACGDQQSIEQLAQWLQQGPSMARVDHLSQESTTFEHYSGFECL